MPTCIVAAIAAAQVACFLEVAEALGQVLGHTCAHYFCGLSAMAMQSYLSLKYDEYQLANS
jgi:hypothetical protein